MTSETPPCRVLLIEDDIEQSAMLQQYLETEGFKVGAASNGPDGLSAALADRYDVVILDIMLPGMNGIEVLRLLRRDSQIPVIMLTAKGDNVERVVGLECGADDYVAKPYYPRELVARVRAVMRRRPPAEPPERILSFGPLQVETESRRATIHARPLQLTASEFNILAALLHSGDRVTTKEDLSLKVLGRVRQPYDRSIDVHVSNIRHKLQSASRELEIETVRGFGYRLKSAG